MRDEKYLLSLDRYDRNILLNALSALKKNQVMEERPTDPVDELIVKVSLAPIKRIKGARDYHEER